MSPVLDAARVRRALGLEETAAGGRSGGDRSPEPSSGPSGTDAASGGGPRFTSFAVDSREVEPGALFFALAGERHHGLDFVEEAAERGARGAVVPRDRGLPDVDLAWFPVEEPREALLRLAADVRRDDGAEVVGITGSSGKTTVKEMVAAALGGGPDVHRTEGNLNSQVGLPLSILSAPAEASTWVLEMGTNAPGEIARLVEVARPDHGVVTTVGPAHLEKLGDLEGVLDEKLDLVRGIPGEGTVVVGERPPELPRAARRIRPDCVVAGLDEDSDWRPDTWSVGAESVSFERAGVRRRVPAGGEHHLRDAVMAAALADALGVEPREAARGLERFRPLEMRGALERMGGLAVVVDCYNANPESFEAAIGYCVEAFEDRPRAAAVGSMLELGEHAEEAHRRVARRLREAGFHPVVATGAFVSAFRSLGAGADDGVVFADGPTEAGRELAGRLAGDEVVLVKGSRGARLEAAVDVLREEFGRPEPGSAASRSADVRGGGGVGDAEGGGTGGARGGTAADAGVGETADGAGGGG